MKITDEKNKINLFFLISLKHIKNYFFNYFFNFSFKYE